MKFILLVSVIVASIFFDLKTYQPLEPGGVVESLVARVPVYLEKPSRINFERRNDGTLSCVISVNGHEEFKRSVIATSFSHPVVVFVHSAIDADSYAMSSVVQSVADEFKKRVVFVSMALLAQHDRMKENYELIMHFMQHYNMAKLELPILLFFKNGELYAPMHESSVFLQGIYTKENLEAFIENKFFPINNNAVGRGQLDFVPTVTTARDVYLPSSSSDQQGKKTSLRKRIINFFKRKKD